MRLRILWIGCGAVALVIAITLFAMSERRKVGEMTVGECLEQNGRITRFTGQCPEATSPSYWGTIRYFRKNLGKCCLPLVSQCHDRGGRVTRGQVCPKDEVLFGRVVAGDLKAGEECITEYCVCCLKTVRP